MEKRAEHRVFYKWRPPLRPPPRRLVPAVQAPPGPLRGLDQVTADILALEQQADGLISDIMGVQVAALSEVE